MFKVIKNHIVIPIPKTTIEDYNIPLNMCDSPEKITSWVFKLCDYSWVDKGIISEFITTASAIHGIKLPAM